MCCTIGAKIIEAGRELVMFKNKDLPRNFFHDYIVVEPQVFGVRGLHIPEGTRGEQNIFSGFSIGVNAAGVCACNSHVRSIKGGENYDLLTEAAIRGTRSAAEACQVVTQLARRELYNWANIIIADPYQVVVFEVAQDLVHQGGQHVVVRANNHLLEHVCGDTVKLTPRASRALELLQAARGPLDVMGLCAYHDEYAVDASICAHGFANTSSGDFQRNTVYSYILHWRACQWDLYVKQGHPCEGGYVHIPLRFPLNLGEVKSVYPT